MSNESLELYGTEVCPIRCSSFPALVACPARFALSYLDQLQSESGPAADTGSVAHHGVKLWHEGKSIESIREALRDAAAEFPKADVEEAEKFVLNYTKDSRNFPDACVAVELRLEFTLPPHPYDPTQRPIHCTGTCDQVRKDNMGLSVWDYKTGSADGGTMLNWFTPQLAGYTYGVRKMFPEPPRIGGIIRGRGYSSRGKNKPELNPSGVFFESVVEAGAELNLLLGVRLAVALIRRGEPFFGPGESCIHCPLGGLGACLPTGRRYGLVVIE